AALAKTRGAVDAGKLELVEINEAFAAVAITSTRMLEVVPERVNVNGGAIAIGHPIGASGARILMTLLYELRRRGGGYGAARICSGIAQGEATLVRVDGTSNRLRAPSASPDSCRTLSRRSRPRWHAGRVRIRSASSRR